ncbi:MAG: HAD-IIIA family hydrolase [Candidatus Woesearchaeota archaeon]
MAEWAVFIDRDGVINDAEGFITSPEHFKLLPRSAEALKLLNDNKIKAIVITNQPVIGRGLCKEEDVHAVHEKMNLLLKEKGAKVDDIFFCPHHPVHGVGDYKVECDCRKPRPGLILEAAKQHNINMRESYMIGDKTGDVKAGFLAGCTTILVQTGYGGNDGFKDATPDIVVEDLYEAVKFILKQKKVEE